MHDNESKSRPAMMKTLIAFLALSAFMYVTITYKIIHYGP